MTRPGCSRRPSAPAALAVAVMIVTLTSGCALTPPKPWEKDLLARPAMALDADPLDGRIPLSGPWSAVV